MKKVLRSMALLLVAGLMLAGCSSPQTSEPKKNSAPVEKKEIIVSAAASLKNAMSEIETMYEGENAGIDLTFNFGSSGSLQKQIEQGAPADLFFSAGKSQVDSLEEKNLLLADTRKDVLLNELVLVAGKDDTKITGFDDLKKAEKIGIGTPESVPAGKYAKEALTSMKLWDSLESKFVQAKDVTQVLTYVESGNVEAGLVYKSDTVGSDKVKIVASAPADSHSPIIYPAAVIAATKNPAEAKAFMDYLSSGEAQKVFEKYGFKIGK